MSGIDNAIAAVGTEERFGSARIDQARAIRVLIGIVETIRPDVERLSIVAALTDYTPRRLAAYRRAVDTLANLGTYYVSDPTHPLCGHWLSGHGV